MAPWPRMQVCAVYTRLSSAPGACFVGCSGEEIATFLVFLFADPLTFALEILLQSGSLDGATSENHVRSTMGKPRVLKDRRRGHRQKIRRSKNRSFGICPYARLESCVDDEAWSRIYRCETLQTGDHRSCLHTGRDEDTGWLCPGGDGLCSC